VLVDVELIQVDSTKLRDIGMTLSDYTPTFTLDPTDLGGSAANGVPLSRVGDITRSMWNVVLPTVTINLIKSSGEAETLAQPQLRITEGQKGSLVIGDQEPIPTTTFNTSNTIGGSIVPITAFQYKDVGIKIELEPRVHHNNEVTLKLKVEASERTGDVTFNGQTMPTFGTRNIDSVIRLKDGETSLLAGLIRYRKRDTESGIPFLSDLPVLGALFRGNHREVNKTDLVLTLTPHIVRNPDITEEDLAPLWVGTENRVTVFGNSPQVRSAIASNPLGEPVSPAEGDTEQPPPDADAQQQEVKGPRIGVPRRHSSLPPVSPIQLPPGGEPQGSASEQGVSAGKADGSAQAANADAGLPTLTFYPARLPAVVGREGELTVVLDPGAFGVSPPLNLAYDPTRLEVTRVEGGDLPGTDGHARVQVSHTPAAGWITVGWTGKAVGTGTLVRMTVKPLAPGEIQVIFAGPIGAVVSSAATVVALPGAAGEAPQ